MENTETNQGRTFTQAELDAIIGDRVARERSKFADYEELKSKASQFDEIADANKTELQKATERVAELEAQIAAREAADKQAEVISSISKEYRIPEQFRSLLTASDEEGLREQAKLLGEKFAEPSHNEGKKPADVSAPQDETADFLNALSNLCK